MSRYQHRLLAGARREFLAPLRIESFAPQRLVTVIADVSGSMVQSVAEVQGGLQDYRKGCLRDPITRERIRTQLVTFGGTVQVYPFVDAQGFAPPRLEAAGGTPLAEAVLQSIGPTEQQVEILRRAELEVGKPAFFLLTDGIPSSSPDALAEMATTVRLYEETGRGAFYTFGVDDAAVARLHPLFVRRPRLLTEFREFFQLLGASVRQMSVGSADEDLDIDRIIQQQRRRRDEGRTDA